jgi:hypothetical protein
MLFPSRFSLLAWINESNTSIHGRYHKYQALRNDRYYGRVCVCLLCAYRLSLHQHVLIVWRDREMNE